MELDNSLINICSLILNIFLCIWSNLSYLCGFDWILHKLCENIKAFLWIFSLLIFDTNTSARLQHVVFLGICHFLIIFFVLLWWMNPSSWRTFKMFELLEFSWHDLLNISVLILGRDTSRVFLFFCFEDF